jgi:hypothetical protein
MSQPRGRVGGARGVAGAPRARRDSRAWDARAARWAALAATGAAGAPLAAPARTPTCRASAIPADYRMFFSASGATNSTLPLSTKPAPVFT